MLNRFQSEQILAKKFVKVYDLYNIMCHGNMLLYVYIGSNRLQKGFY